VEGTSSKYFPFIASGAYSARSTRKDMWSLCSIATCLSMAVATSTAIEVSGAVVDHEYIQGCSYKWVLKFISNCVTNTLASAAGHRRRQISLECEFDVKMCV
jgi:hypothetical protein